MNWDNLSLKQEKKLYTGKAKVKVLAVNPSKEKIADLLGIDVEKIKDPNYDNKLVVYVGNNNTLAKGTFWIKNEYVPTSQTGKTKYINDYCANAYIENLDDTSELDWFSRTGARKAKEGECEIYDFFTNWIGIDTSKGEFKLPFEAFCTGDVSDFEEAIKRFGNKEFVVLLGVASGKYQEFYTRKFARTFAANFKDIRWGEREYSLDVMREYKPVAQPDALESSNDLDIPDTTMGDIPF